MQLNISKLQEDIQEILFSLVAPVPVILQEQEGDKPAESYLTFQLKDWSQIGSSTQTHVGGTSPDYEIQTLWKVKLNLMSVGVDANQIIISISQKLNRTTARLDFESIGLKYQYQEDVKHAPKLLTTGWEQRFHLDACFNIKLIDVEALNYFEFLYITTNVEDPTGNTVATNTQVVDIVP